MSNKDKIKPRGRPKASSLRKLTKSVTVKFSKPDYDRLCLRSRQANRTLAEVYQGFHIQCTDYG